MIDKGTVSVIAHVTIRDPDSGEIILKRRDPNIVIADQSAEPQQEPTDE